MLSAVRSVLAFFDPAPAAEAVKPIAEKHVRAAVIGRGTVDPERKGVRRIVITVDDELFERMRARAVSRHVPMAAEIRHLLACGLDAGGGR